MAAPNQAHIIRSAASLTLAGLLAYALYQMFLPFFLPVVIGGIIALISMPLYENILKKLRSPGFSALVTAIILLVIILVPLTGIVSALVVEISNLSVSIQLDNFSLISLNLSVNNWLSHFGIHQYFDIQSYLLQSVEFLGTKSTVLIGSILGTIGTAFLAMITAIYTYTNHEKVQEVAKKYSPLNPEDTELIWHRAKEVIEAAIKGNIILVCLQALTSMLGFWLFGVGAPVLLGVLYGIASLVPGVGSSLVWIPVALYQMSQGHYLAALGVIIWSCLQVLGYDNFLGPRLIQRRAELHPFLVLLGVLGGVAQFGVLGIILGPTLVALGIVGLEIIYRSWQTET